MHIEDAARSIQRSYPKVYLACHSAHARRATHPEGLSRRDSQVLQHLDRQPPYRAGELARHLGIGRPALSAALERLEKEGLVARRRAEDDRRQVECVLTERGRELTDAASVLEWRRLCSVLADLSDDERAAAARGLEILATASGRLMDRHEGERA